MLLYCHQCVLIVGSVGHFNDFSSNILNSFIVNVTNALETVFIEVLLRYIRSQQGIFICNNTTLQCPFNCARTNEKAVEAIRPFFLISQNIFLAPRYLPEPEIVSIPVEPAGETETGPAYTRNQRGKRSLPQDNTGRLASQRGALRQSTIEINFNII